MQSQSYPTTVLNASAALLEWLDPSRGNHTTWGHAKSMLGDLADSAATSNLRDFEESVQLLLKLLEIVDTQASPDSKLTPDLKEMLTFVQSRSQLVIEAVDGDQTNQPAIASIAQEAIARWGDCLQLSESENFSDLPSGNQSFESTTAGVDSGNTNSRDLENCVAADQISLLLAAIREGADSAMGAERRVVRPDGNRLKPLGILQNSDPQCEMLADADLRDAFLHDATRCLGGLEKLALELENGPPQADQHRSICRELHTLKGACASVGLADMADYLHQLEELVQERSTAKEAIDGEFLLSSVDALRKHVESVAPLCIPMAVEAPAPTALVHSNIFASNPAAGTLTDSDAEGQNSVRVRSSKLDRLMDLLAELVVLRNRRDTQITELTTFDQELRHCTTRLKRFADQLDQYGKSLPLSERTPGGNPPLDVSTQLGLSQLGLELASSKSISEVANDLAEISRRIKSVTRPIGEENVALSHFIRQFRQEMMELRRLPVSGLFQRLQRAARDAARVEGKQVQIEIIGQHPAIEQSLQEKLYEPLLHIVRNAVSHGIETPAVRSAQGKMPAGRVSFHFTSSANLLVISVSDDGRGLDYDTIRRRGYERGLLSPDRLPTHQELAKLIFHPGFTTRDAATEISGRGVGMDVVSAALDRLHGRIEINSTNGQGTTIRLSIPLRNGIEHAMVFRSSGQLFAVPMQSVNAVQTAAHSTSLGDVLNNEDGSAQTVSFARVAQLTNQEIQPDHRLLVLDLDLVNREGNSRINLIVDEIVGGEEVVVRALPKSLKNHPFASGVTLSGGGQTVLTIDPVRLGELCQPYCGQLSQTELRGIASDSRKQVTCKALVVDDSLSARLSLVQALRRYGLETVEACDGMEALDRLRGESFDLVLTDLDMPRLGGMELLTEICQRRLLEAPVVVVSGRTEEALRNRALRYGARAFLNKPVSDQAMHELLQELSLVAL